MISLDGSILCRRLNGMLGLDVQVQSDHYEDFYAPELEKHGYTGVYKKKTGEVKFPSFRLF